VKCVLLGMQEQMVIVKSDGKAIYRWI